MGRTDLPVLPPSSFLLGLFSLLAQVILIREIFVVFYGSELNIGLVLAAWLLWVGIGSLAGTKIPEPLRAASGRTFLLPLLQTVTALALPVTILLVRSLRLWAPAGPGEFLPFRTTALLTVGLLAGIGLLFGLWFTLAASLPSEGRTGPGRTYAWEAVGGLAGGTIFSFFLADRMDGLHLAFILASLLAAASLAMASGDRSGVSKVRPVAILLLVAAPLLTLLRPSPLDRWSVRTHSWRWPEMEMVDSRDSRYGNLALLRLGDQLTLFENGVPGYSFPDPLAVLESVHLPLLAAPAHGRILLVGGGVGGGIGEILRYPVGSLDYLELDPEAVGIMVHNLPPQLEPPLRDGRVRLLYQDGRSWLRRRGEPYDVILLNLPEPSTAMINRFYTREFFELARENLSPPGVLALSLSASPNYYGKALQLRNGSIYRTLRSVFPAVAALPAGKTLLLASSAPGGVDLDPATLDARLDAVSAGGGQPRPEVIASFLESSRRTFIERELTAGDAALNRDFSPAAYFYHTIFWSSLSDPELSPLLRSLLGPPRFWPFLLPLLLLVPGLWHGRRRSPRSARALLGLAAFTTGWGAMTFHYLVLFVFQTSRGHLYRQIGILNGAFMSGLAAGSFISLRLRTHTSCRSLLILSEGVLAAWPLLLGIALHGLAGKNAPSLDPVADGAFVLLSVFSGFCAGFQFPLFSILHREEEGGPGRAGGRYYFLDLAGSGLGALLASLWLLPLLGIPLALLLCALLKTVSLISTARVGTVISREGGREGVRAA